MFDYIFVEYLYVIYHHSKAKDDGTFNALEKGKKK